MEGWGFVDCTCTILPMNCEGEGGEREEREGRELDGEIVQRDELQYVWIVWMH